MLLRTVKAYACFSESFEKLALAQIVLFEKGGQLVPELARHHFWWKKDNNETVGLGREQGRTEFFPRDDYNFDGADVSI